LTYDNPWTYNGKVFESEDIAEYVAFVYKIKNLTNGKQYIGKKLFNFTKTKQVKKKKKRFKVESDWKTSSRGRDYVWAT
jgi:Putative endonuclease segE, GIY-YIG domain